MSDLEVLGLELPLLVEVLAVLHLLSGAGGESREVGQRGEAVDAADDPPQVFSDQLSLALSILEGSESGFGRPARNG